MASLYDALIGNYDEKDYLGLDPYFSTGAKLSQFQVPTTAGSNAGFWGPLLSGLAGGALKGYGQYNSNRTAFEDVQSSPLMKAFTSNVGPVANAEQYEKMLAYSSGEMPDDWTIKQGKTDLILAAIQKEAQQEEALKKLAIKERLASTLAGKGLAIDPEGNVAKIPGFQEAQADLEKDKAKAKAEGEKAGKGASSAENIPAAVRASLAEQKAIVDEATELGATLVASGKSWGDLQSAAMFSGLDEDGISARISDLADRVMRSRSGATAPPAEAAVLRKIVAGDKSVTPKQAGELILKFADRERANAKSQVDLLTTADITTAFNAPASSTQAPGPAAPGMKWQRSNLGNWRQVPQ